MTLAALVLASALAPAPGRDHATTVATFLSALHGTVAPDTSDWTTRESMADSTLLTAGQLGIARLRGDDGKLLTWRRLAEEGSHARRTPPTGYINEEQARQLASAFLERWSRTDLEIGETRVTRDNETPLGDYVQGRAFVRLTARNDPPFWGALRRGATLSFDSADGKPLAFSEKDRVATVRAETTVTVEEALRIADGHVAENWHGIAATAIGTTHAYCASLEEFAVELESGRNPMYRDTLTTYWCLIVHYDQPPGSWVAVRLSDGVPVWAALSP